MIFLAIGLVAFALLWAAPVVLLTWAVGMLFGSAGIAEALERTRGLAPTTYGGAFWLAVTITVVMGVVEIRAMLSKAKERRSFFLRFITRPSTAYWVLFLPTLLLVRIDIKGTDVPDILTTTLLLCCLGYVWFILPLALAAVAWRLTRWMWRKGAGSSFLAGAFGMLGLAFASCTPLVCVVDEDQEPWAPRGRVGKAFDRGLDRASGQDAVDGSRAFMGVLAEVSGGEPKALAPAPTEANDDRKGLPLIQEPYRSESDVDGGRFDECVDTLYEGHPDSPRNQRVGLFVYTHHLTESDAEDIIDRSVLEVCTRHATMGREPLRSIIGFFKRRTDSRRKNFYRDRDRRERCLAAMAAEPSQASDERWFAESSALEQAWCRLQDHDRDILKLSALGHDASEIGAKLGHTADAVRQRKRRALEKLRRLLQLH